MKKVALIVGHKPSQKGAAAYNGTYEYDFNSLVATKAKELINSDRLEVFHKVDNYMIHVINYKPTLIIELHFNAFKEKVYGCEALVPVYGKGSKVEAEAFLKAFSKKFKIKSRGIKIVDKGSRGFKNIFPLRKFDVFLFEPCFANLRTSDSEKIIENPDEYSKFLADYISKYIGHSEKTSSKISSNFLTTIIMIIKSWFK